MDLMDSARDKYSREIIDAEQLWDMEVVDKEGYECPGCGIQVFPASFKKHINKRRPYFTPMDNKHVQPCGVDGLEKLVRKAKHERMGSPDGFPVPFPNKLILTDTRPVTATTAGSLGAATDPRPSTRPNSARNDSYHGHTVKTIRPICRVFMEYPHDRDHLELGIPGCPGATYTTVFSKLSYFGIRPLSVPTRLFYAALRWNTPSNNEDHIEWQLDAGTWTKGEKRPSQFYRVRIAWASWTEHQRETLRHEIEIAQDEVKGKSDQPEKAWLFFVGTQDADDPGLLVAERYQFVCCRIGEMVWPQR